MEPLSPNSSPISPSGKEESVFLQRADQRPCRFVSDAEHYSCGLASLLDQ